MRTKVNKMTDSFSKILKEKIQAAETIVISAHAKADGDALGSTLAAAALVESLGKKPVVFLTFKGDKFDYIFDRSKIFSGDKDSLDPDVFIALDCGSPKRLEDVEGVFERSATKFNIDHHISNDLFGDYNYVEPGASSTCELMYEVISGIAPIDRYMAECLYTGILTDTGGFRHSCTGDKTMRIAGELMSRGIDFSEIQQRVFHRRSMSAAKVFAKAVLNAKLKGNIAYTKLSLIEIRSVGAIFEELDGIVEYCLGIKGAKAAVFLYEKEKNVTKCSFRSMGADVNKVASLFGGGGHERAAGCTLEGMSLDKATDTVLEALKVEMENGEK